ncbi:hypothetical protein ACLOJK_033893 [Asimina triloba]
MMLIDQTQHFGLTHRLIIFQRKLSFLLSRTEEEEEDSGEEVEQALEEIDTHPELLEISMQAVPLMRCIDQEMRGHARGLAGGGNEWTCKSS